MSRALSTTSTNRQFLFIQPSILKLLQVQLLGINGACFTGQIPFPSATINARTRKRLQSTDFNQEEHSLDLKLPCCTNWWCFTRTHWHQQPTSYLTTVLFAPHLVGKSVDLRSSIHDVQFVWLRIGVHYQLNELLVIFISPSTDTHHRLTGTRYSCLTVRMNPRQNLQRVSEWFLNGTSTHIGHSVSYKIVR